MPSRYRRGSALIEFSLVGMAVIFLTLSIEEVSLIAWKYYSLSNSVEIAVRYAVTHGRGCAQNSNSCTVTVANVAQVIAHQAPALDSSKLNVSLNTHSSTTQCNPLNSCFGNTSQFPNNTDNGVNFDITITATYPVANPFPVFWPGSGAVSGSTFSLGATARQGIQF